MLRIRPLAALLLALTLLLAAACSRPAPAGPPANAAPAPLPPATTVRLLYYPWDEGLINTVIDAFYQQNAQIQIEKVLVDLRGNPLDSIREKAGTGEVDLVPAMLREDEAPGLFLPLDDRLAKAGFDLSPIRALPNFRPISGKIYWLPWYINPAVIMYNPDLFVRAGLPQPTAGWTWDDFRTAAAHLTGGRDGYTTWGLASMLGNVNAAEIMAFQRFGATPVEPEAARQILQFWETLIRQDHSALSDAPDPRDQAAQFDYFSAGRAGMSVAFLPVSRYLGAIRTLTFTPGIAPMPEWPGVPPALYYNDSGYAIAAGSPNPDAAFEVLQFMSGPAGAAVLAREGTVPAYRTEASKAAWFEQSPPMARSSEFLFTQPLLPEGVGYSPQELAVLRAFFDAIIQVVRNQASAEEAFQTFMAARTQALAGK